MPEPLYIAGTGSYAAEIAGWAAESGRPAAGLIELRDESRVGSTIYGLPVVSASEPPTASETLIGIGGDRAETWRALAEQGWRVAAALIHPRAELAGSAEASPGATVGPMAVVGASSTLGEHALVSRGALVGHHVVIAEFSTLGPGVNVGGNTVVAASAFLGIGCVVSNGLEVGPGATVAAGGVVIEDVPARSRVQGVPARPYP